MACKHTRGDFINAMWVCADCFSVLNERPVRYDMASGFTEGPRPRQIISWAAGIAVVDGTKFSKFVGWMVSYLRMRSLWTLSRDEALHECLDTLAEQGEPFGSDFAGWSKSDAKELVLEAICAYWDDAPHGSNL